MKKNIFLFVFLVSILSVSCDKIKEITEVDIKIDIQADIPVISQKVADGVYGFVGAGAFTLADIPELEKYMDNLRNIVAEDGSSIRFTGAVSGDKILSLKLRFGIQMDEGTIPELEVAIDHQDEIPANEGVIEYKDDTWTPKLINALNANKDKTLVLSIEGVANYSLNSIVKVKIPVTISATPFNE